ncbi:hypothetical protein AB0N05_11485 [Nocardia sp. NPDC051030]|uniref:hypothetical protein n=1 Tax=Nocardia sp. NPDC051030 TaxID=3155162 RepID=UPI0034223EEC
MTTAEAQVEAQHRECSAGLPSGWTVDRFTVTSRSGRPLIAPVGRWMAEPLVDSLKGA